MKITSQKVRLLFLGVYLAALFIACRLALGIWLPPSGEKGLWFYSGLAALLLGNLIISPLFTKPADAVSYAVAGLVALLTASGWYVSADTHFETFLWYLALTYVLMVLISAMLAIAFRNDTRPVRKKLAYTLFQLADFVGQPRAIFSVIFLYALVAFHRHSPREYLVIGLAWALVVAFRPLESISTFLARIRRVWRASPAIQPFGEIVGHQVPDLLLIRQKGSADFKLGDALVARTEGGEVGLALALDAVGYSEGRWLRAIHLPAQPESGSEIQKVLEASRPFESEVLKIDPSILDLSAINEIASQTRAHLLGLVAPGTDITRLRFEILRTDLDIEEGRLVEVSLRGRPVLFQIINGFTKEEILQQKNTRGFVSADAKKIGTWNEASQHFDVVKWIPRPNAQVTLVEAQAPPTRLDAVGHFPGTSYPVMVDVDTLITHNTAILGILGIGKTCLSLELAERMIAKGVKVICLDLTNQYAHELDPYHDTAAEREVGEELQRIGVAGRTNVQRNVEEGGSINEYREAVRNDLQTFLDPRDARRLKFYNPTAFEVWKQDSRPFNEQASMASLTPPEITRIISEATLEILKDSMSDSARCCIIFEEAHSLIPEWNAVASEGDKAATNGTAKAILQGRKYGLGCFVVTQRTAHVTKSILNQCNTVFAMRVFDATGMEYLRNYIGEDYTGVLSTLEDRHAVVFGRASSCRDPVLIRVNQREDFVRAFREAHPPDQTRPEKEVTI